MKTSTSRNVLVGALAALALSAASYASPITADMIVGKWAPASDYNNVVDTTTASVALIDWENGGVSASTALGGTTIFSLGAGFADPLPSIEAYSTSDESAPFGSLDATLTQYVVGKYGNVAYLFFLGYTGTWELAAKDNVYGSTAANGNGNGLSHWRSFTADDIPPPPPPPPVEVPDSGTSAIMLGLGLISLALFRRKAA